MTHYKMALLGFGNVGKALARLLLRKRAEMHSLYGLTFTVTAIATGRHGMAIDPDGIDLERALNEDIRSLSKLPAPANSWEFIRQSQADVLFENSPVNYETGQPAIDHLRGALEMGMHAITANKGPVVHAYQALTDLAKANGRKFYFESAVMDGAPIFSLFRETLPAARLLSFRGVLNSTTNLILTRMETGESFDQAVAYAQAVGLAETDPSGDIDGWDASVKVAALSTVLMGIPLKPQDVDRQGIRAITLDEIERARQEGKRWKLVCTAERKEENGQECVAARVAPEMVGIDSPLYGVNGSTSIVQFKTDVLTSLSVIETDPSPDTTAYGLLADFLNAVRE